SILQRETSLVYKCSAQLHVLAAGERTSVYFNSLSHGDIVIFGSKEVELHGVNTNGSLSFTPRHKAKVEAEGSMLCVLCCSKPRDTALQPCGHLFSCGPCLEKLSQPLCPVCRNHIEG